MTDLTNMRTMHAFLLGAAAAPTLASPTITLIAGVPEPTDWVIPYAISADGSTVVGTWESADGHDRSFRWTAGGGFEEIGPFGGTDTRVAAVSADGSIAVGSRVDLDGGPNEGWYAPSGQSPTFIGFTSSYRDTGLAAVADTGAVAAGSTRTETGRATATRWTAAGGFERLDPGDAWSISSATGISADGSTVVGLGSDPGSPSLSAFRWTEETGMVNLGDLPGGELWAFAQACDADGSAVVGGSIGENGWEAFRWTEEGGMAGLGFVGDTTRSSAMDVSADGSIVVGWADGGDGPSQAWVWTETLGVRSLMSFLDPNQTEWLSLGAAAGISADGTVITGYGTYADGTRQGFVLHVPAPAAAPVLALALVARPRRR